jgi:hypothetical protein
MRRPHQTIRLLGRHYRELAAVEAALPVEMQVLLLRLALQAVERACHGEQEQHRFGAVAD